MLGFAVARDSPRCHREQRLPSASTDTGSQAPDEFSLAPRGKTLPASVQVRNTFIHLEDDSTPPRVRPRSKTLDCSLLSGLGEVDGGTESESTGAEDEPLEGLACSTPTPHASAGPWFAMRQSVLAPQAHAPVLLPVLWPLAGPAGEPASADLEGVGRPSMTGGAPALPSCPREQLVASLAGTADGFVRIHWTVDARKLRGSDKQLASSNFDVDLGLGLGSVVFKVMLATFGGTQSFKKTGGVGYVQVKCASEGDINTKIRVSIGRGDRQRPPRGPFTHSFSDSPVFTLPRQQAEWDFWDAADEQSMTLVVNVDIAPLVEA